MIVSESNCDTVMDEQKFIIEEKNFTFKALQALDFPLFFSWFKQPHVAEWWSIESKLSTEQLYAKYAAKLYASEQAAFIVYYENKPIGYIQWYNAHVYEKQPVGTYGIDQFIAEPQYVGKGYGAVMIKAFITILFEKEVATRIIVDPHPCNIRAICCYEKIGFVQIGPHAVRGEESLVMEFKKE